MAPIAPFYADRLFCDLIAVTGRETVESVHLSDFPKYDEALIDKDLEERMQMAQDVSSMVLALRRKVNIKVRQPLQTIMVPVVDAHQQESIEAVKALILNEVNVKELKFVDNAAGILVKKYQAGLQEAGPALRQDHEEPGCRYPKHESGGYPCIRSCRNIYVESGRTGCNR